jgi:phosphoribosylamine--glycine ligase
MSGADASDDVGHRAGAVRGLRRAIETLKHFDLRWFPAPALTVVMAAKGYPGEYVKGAPIEGLDEAAKVDGVEIFHAGTRAEDGRVLANGGRVLNVCASGKTVAEAQRRAYEAVDRIKWPEGFCRRDIGWQAVARERSANTRRGWPGRAWP